MRFVWGILPYFTRKAKANRASARGPIIYLPDGPTKTEISHEKFHVKQWYAFFLLSILLAAAAFFIGMGMTQIPYLWASIPAGFAIVAQLVQQIPFVRIRKEWAACGESIRTMEKMAPGIDIEKIIHLYADALDNDPAYKYERNTLEEHKNGIRSRYKSGSLF